MPKIVIDIPLGDYKWIKNHVMTVNEQAIASGKLLSEVLEDIKSEITEYMNDCATTSVYTRLGFQTSLNVIDRHIGERSEDGINMV